MVLIFEKEFKKIISKSTVNNIIYEKFGKPNKGVNSVLLTEDHIKQRLAFSNGIIEKELKLQIKCLLVSEECFVS